MNGDQFTDRALSEMRAKFVVKFRRSPNPDEVRAMQQVVGKVVDGVAWHWEGGGSSGGRIIIDLGEKQK